MVSRYPLAYRRIVPWAFCAPVEQTALTMSQYQARDRCMWLESEKLTKVAETLLEIPYANSDYEDVDSSEISDNREEVDD